VQITTLGTLTVDGTPVRGERLAAVVRMLLDARGRALSSTALAEAVWQGDPPEDAAGAVQALVSRARRLGLGVVAVPGGYRLPLDGLHVDAAEAAALAGRARAALRAGEAATARRLADEARALLPGVLDPADARATRLLADVVAVRAEAGLDDPAALTPDVLEDLRRCALRTPPDEPLVALLVRVLAVQGRDAEALELVETVRAELADRYGTDPSPVVAQAHLALLRGELAAPDGTGTGPSGTGTARSPGRAEAGRSCDHQPPGALEPPDEARPAPAPPARTVDATTTGHLTDLPPAWRRAPTALLGRDDDLAAVEHALTGSALVTLVATGGAGKTRLAAEVARRAAAAGRPVRVVELAGVRSPGEVLPTVLAVLGGAESTTARTDLSLDRRLLSRQERLRQAASTLAAAGGLLVLDNCEHLLDATADVTVGLLEAADPGLTVLATSRAPLGLVAETVHRLGTLPDEDAVALLHQRARAGRPTLAWDGERARELCRRLDNLPLALELAAARLRSMPVEDVLDGLRDRFALLDDALRGLPERHASLWALVDWSRELLDPPERALLQRLAVVPAPFTAETAVAVADTSDPDVRRGLAVLVEQSLLVLDEGDGGPARYRMLETVREYGEARLDAAGEREAAMTGLLSWARREAARLGERLIGPTDLDALDRAVQEVDTFLAALRWAIDHDDEPAAVDVASCLVQVWTVRGLHGEATGWIARLLHADDPAGRRRSAVLQGATSSRPLPHADRLGTVLLFGAVNAGALDTPRLAVLAGRALDRLHADRPDELSPRVRTLAGALPVMSAVLDEDGTLRAAAALVADEDVYLQALGLFLRAAVDENRGDPDGSAVTAQEAYRRFASIDDHWGMAMAAAGIGQWAAARSADSAVPWLRRGIAHFERLGALQDARGLQVLLDVQKAGDGDEDAVRRLHETTASTQVDGFDAGQAHLGLAQVAWKAGRVREAVRHTEDAVALAGSVPFPQARLLFRVAAAVAHLRAEDAGDAHGGMERAVELLTLARADVGYSDDMPVLGSYAIGAAELAVRQGDAERAVELWACGTRLGATLGRWRLDPGTTDPLGALLGDDAQQETLLRPWRDRPATAAARRITELTG